MNNIAKSSQRSDRFLIIVDSIINIGDRLILWSEISAIEDILKSDNIEIVQWNPLGQDYKDQSPNGSYQIIQPLTALYNALTNKYDAIFFGGGNLVRGNVSYRWLAFNITISLASALSGILLFGVSLGATNPISRTKRILYSLFLRFYTSIYARDLASAARIKSIVPVSCNVRLSSDFVYYETNTTRQNFRIPARIPPYSKIGFCFAIDGGEKRGVEVRELIETLRRNVSISRNSTATIIVQDSNFDKNDALSIIEKELRTFGFYQVKTLKPSTIKEYLTHIGNFDCIISNRLHFCITGDISNADVFSIIDESGKLLPFAEQMNWSQFVRTENGYKYFFNANLNRIEITKSRNVEIINMMNQIAGDLQKRRFRYNNI